MHQHQRAGYPFLWVATSEEDRIIRENRIKIPPDVKFVRWDIAGGMRGFANPNGDPSQWIWEVLNGDLNNPIEALDAIHGIPDNSIIFMHDYHEFLKDVTVARYALNIKDHLKSSSKMVVFLSHTVDIPQGMKDVIKVLNFDMPNEQELKDLLHRICANTKMPVPENEAAIVDAMRGLTLEGAESALALSLVEEGGFGYKIILDAKAAMLKATGYLKYLSYGETFDDLFGLEYLKDYAPTCVASGKGKGILIAGYPGTGKSHFAKALAAYTKTPCLNLNFSALRGGLVGLSEANTQDAFKRIEAFNRATVFVDEIEKSFEGMESGGDSGVGDRIGQEFLKYWEDREIPGSYWVATANGLDTMLDWSGGALISRFDAVFFLDMPTRDECKGIAKIWSEKLNVDVPDNFDFDGWTGRDIKKLANTMDMMGTCAEKAAKFVIPTSQALGPARLKAIKKKAQNVCIPASASEAIRPTARKVKVGGGKTGGWVTQ
jgi:hypothetical protein